MIRIIEVEKQYGYLNFEELDSLTKDGWEVLKWNTIVEPEQNKEYEDQDATMSYGVRHFVMVENLLVQEEQR